MIYLFKTTATLKDYNYKKYWIDSGIVRPVEIEADSIEEALKEFQAHTEEEEHIIISNNALKHKEPMYIDTNEGAQQCGYVITAQTEIDTERAGYVKQYIDLWVTIKIVKNPFTEAVQ